MRAFHAHKRLVVLTLALGLLGPVRSQAEPLLRQPAPPSTLRSRAKAFALQNNRTPVTPRLLTRLGQKPLVKLRTTQQAAQLATQLGHSFEVIFRPSASDDGHIHIRAGDMLYDFGAARFARATPMQQADVLLRGAYGFVFESDAATIARMKQTFGDKVQKAKSGQLAFSIAPWQTHHQGQNCETFVTSTLHELAPGLSLYPQRSYRGAVGLGRFCLNSDKTQCVTVYGRGDPTTSDSFRFDKLDR